MVLTDLPFSSVEEVITPPVQFQVMDRERVNGSLIEVTKELPQAWGGVPVLSYVYVVMFGPPLALAPRSLEVFMVPVS